MPELPEVETIARRLNNLLPGRQIIGVKILHPKSFQGESEQIVGAKITQVDRRAKILRLGLQATADSSSSGSSEKLNLLIHLKMTGQLIFVSDGERVGGGHPTADWVSDLPTKHTRVIFTFADGSQLFFNDMRIFGWIKLLDREGIEAEFAKYGPDINDENLTVAHFFKHFPRRSQNIKQVIMNNQVVAGIGNIYASEALHLAKIHPQRSAKELSEKEVKRLFKTAQKVVLRAIEVGGTTFDGKYVNVEGFAGGYQNELRVYGQEGEACPNCDAEIKKIKLGGRGTYFCESCQI